MNLLCNRQQCFSIRTARRAIEISQSTFQCYVYCLDTPKLPKLQEGEYDVPASKESSPQPASGPVTVRADKVKAEFQDAENLKVKLDHKEDDIRELKKALKLKAEELSAQHVRVGMVSTLWFKTR